MEIFNRTRLVFLTLTLLLLAACKEEPENIVEKKKYVSTSPLGEILIEHTSHYPARAVSLNNSILSSELSARILEFHVGVGDEVTQGELLVSLDCKDVENQQLQAKARLTASKATAKLSELEYHRGLTLAKKKTISKQSLDQLKGENDRDSANQNEALAAYQIATSNIHKCHIRAPFDAVVVERMASKGQLTAPSSNVIHLTDRHHLEVSARLPSETIASLEQSQSLLFIHNEQHYPLAIRKIVPVIHRVSRTQEVRLFFKQAQPLPGSSGVLAWTQTLKALPPEYLSLRNEQLGVLYAVAKDKRLLVDFYPIPDAREGQSALVQLNDQLTANTPIIIDGRFGVRSGEEVFIAPTPSH